METATTDPHMNGSKPPAKRPKKKISHDRVRVRSEHTGESKDEAREALEQLELGEGFSAKNQKAIAKAAAAERKKAKRPAEPGKKAKKKSKATQARRLAKLKIGRDGKARTPDKAAEYAAQEKRFDALRNSIHNVHVRTTLNDVETLMLGEGVRDSYFGHQKKDQLISPYTLEPADYVALGKVLEHLRAAYAAWGDFTKTVWDRRR